MGTVEQLLPKIFFRFGHFYFFANLFMGRGDRGIMGHRELRTSVVFFKDSK